MKEGALFPKVQEPLTHISHCIGMSVRIRKDTAASIRDPFPNALWDAKKRFVGNFLKKVSHTLQKLPKKV